MMTTYTDFVNETVGKKEVQALLDKYEFGPDVDELQYIFGDKVFSVDDVVKTIKADGLTLAQVEDKIKKALNL